MLTGFQEFVPEINALQVKMEGAQAQAEQDRREKEEAQTKAEEAQAQAKEAQAQVEKERREREELMARLARYEAMSLGGPSMHPTSG